MSPSEKTLLKQARRDQRERELAAKILALPDKRYGVILADPGWRFDVWSRETGMDRAADNHYFASIAEGLYLVPVDDAAKGEDRTRGDGSVGLQVQNAAGVDKEVRGTGYWAIDYHELLLAGATSDEYDNLLIGTRGKVPCPAPGTQWPSIVRERKRGHSVKPEWVYQMIERHFPNLPKIELFARRARPGWDQWGAEAPAQAAE